MINLTFEDRNFFLLRKSANMKVAKALKSGSLKKPSLCPGCNKPLPTQPYWEDYLYPMDVLFLCKNCILQKAKEDSIDILAKS